MEANPYQTKKQRREGEVKSLLEKVPADLISLNQDQIAQIDVDALEVRKTLESGAGYQKKTLVFSQFGWYRHNL